MDAALGALLLIAALALWWHGSIQARDRARDLARAFCERQGWQLLDQTVALSLVRPVRVDDGWRIRRRYRFDFSPDGGARSSGELSLLGHRLETIAARLPEGGQLIE